eukprot:2278161-Amphidinium_carterae.2
MHHIASHNMTPLEQQERVLRLPPSLRPCKLQEDTVSKAASLRNPNEASQIGLTSQPISVAANKCNA